MFNPILFAQVTGTESQAAVILGVLGIIGAAAAGTYSRFQSANVKADAARLESAVRNWRDRCGQMEADMEVLYNRLIEAEREKTAWQIRYENLRATQSPQPEGKGD